MPLPPITPPYTSSDQLQQVIDEINRRVQAAAPLGGGAAASVSPAATPTQRTATSGLNFPGGLLGLAGAGALGGAPGAAGGMDLGLGTGGTAALNTGLTVGLDVLGTAFGMPFLGNLAVPAIDQFAMLAGAGPGVPREAKTQAIGQAALQSGVPIEELLGGFIGKGVQGGHVVSESGANTFESSVNRVADFLSGLTGQPMPSITGTGDAFKTPATMNFPGMGATGRAFQLPAGYEFINPNDPQALSKVYNDITNLVGVQSPASGAGATGQWNNLVQELIKQNVHKRYGGPMGAAGGMPMGTTAGTPNVALPHPLTQDQPTLAAPYPV